MVVLLSVWTLSRTGSSLSELTSDASHAEPRAVKVHTLDNGPFIRYRSTHRVDAVRQVGEQALELSWEEWGRVTD